MTILVGGCFRDQTTVVDEFPLDGDIPLSATIQGYGNRRLPRVEYQGTLKSCVGQAISSACEYLTQGSMELSPMFLWYWARFAIAKENENTGCYIRDGVRTLLAYGIPPASMWAHVPGAIGVDPPDSIMRVARAFVCDFYAKPALGLNEVRMWLSQGVPVVGGFDVPTSITGSAFIPEPTSESEGGHAVLFTGYDDDLQVLTFENSWGRDWGVDGFGFLPYSYFFSGHAYDCWAIFR